jgi:hypothetical protein
MQRGILSQIWKDFEGTEPQGCVLLGSCSVSIVFHAFGSIPIFEWRITVLFQSSSMTIICSGKPSILLYLSEQLFVATPGTSQLLAHCPATIPLGVDCFIAKRFTISICRKWTILSIY